MTARAGSSLGYDALQRLTTYGTVDSNVYSVSNQRLVRVNGTTRTLYLPGMDVTVSAGARTITRTLTIDGTPYGTRTLTGGTSSVVWNCVSPQHTLTCAIPAGSTSIPARTRYTPYGTARGVDTIINTDRGHLDQPHDPTGLTYLNNRYYDPTLSSFTSVDPLVGKTGTPYLYAGGNPTTFSDPSGLCWTYVAGQVGGTPDGGVCDKHDPRLEAGRRLSPNERRAIISEFAEVSGQDSIKAISDFTEWEISSGRIEGSAWWATVNGALMLDMQDALTAYRAGEASVSDPNVQNWLDYLRGDYPEIVDTQTVTAPNGISMEVAFTIPDEASGFWLAHQASLHSAIPYADEMYLTREKGSEPAFINVVIGNVDWTAETTFPPRSDNHLPPSMFGGALVGWFINTVIPYPDTYPFRGDASKLTTQSYVDVLRRLLA